MYVNWKQGISTHEFRKQRASDMWLMLEIDNVIQKKQIKMAKVNQALMEARRK